MTLEEAKKLAIIAGTIDGGCSSCINAFTEELNRTFPEYLWTTGDVTTSIDVAWKEGPYISTDYGVIVEPRP